MEEGLLIKHSLRVGYCAEYVQGSLSLKTTCGKQHWLNSCFTDGKTDGSRITQPERSQASGIQFKSHLTTEFAAWTTTILPPSSGLTAKIKSGKPLKQCRALLEHFIFTSKYIKWCILLINPYFPMFNKSTLYFPLNFKCKLKLF